MKALILIATFFLLKVTNAQKCIDSAIRVNYHAVGFNTKNTPNKAVFYETPYISGFTKNDNSKGYFISKILSDGAIDYAKYLVTPTINFKGSLGHKVLKNGNILIVLGGTIAYLASEDLDSTFGLVMLNPVGNIIWAKRYTCLPNCTILPGTVNETTNGDIILSFKYYIDANTANESTNLNGIISISKNSTVNWAKYYEALPQFNSRELLVNESFSISGNNIFVRGVFPPTMFLPNYEHKMYIGKINLANGAMIDSKTYYDLTTNESDFSFPSGNFAAQLTSADGEMILTKTYRKSTLNNTNNPIVGGITKFILDTNLNCKNAALLSTIKNVDFFLGDRALPLANKDVIFYNNRFENNTLKFIYVTKLDSNDNIKREIAFVNPPDSSNGTGYFNPIGTKDKYINILKPFTKNNDTYLQLFQYPDDVPLTDCYGRDTSLLKIEPYSIAQVHHPFLAQGLDVPLTVQDFTVNITPYPLIAEKECVIISSCDAIKILPTNDTICHTSKPVFFSVTKNSDCAKHVSFSILDTSVYEYMRTVNDTTVEVQFKKAFKGKIYSNINSCSILKDSLTITVINTPDSIFLGRDTTLCGSQSLMVNAGNNFKTYQWQDGNTEQQRSLQAAGTYSILATDYCGQKFYDTITIQKYSIPKAIKIGNDTTLCNGQTLILNASKGYKNYSWQNNTTADTLLVNKAGNYFVTATDSCGNTSSDSVVVNFYIDKKPINLGTDAVICNNKSYTITAPNGYKNYEWQDGSTGKTFTTTTAGFYSITVADSCGRISRDTIQLQPQNNNVLQANYTSPLCINDTAILTLPNTFTKYEVQPNIGVKLQGNILKLSPQANTLYTIQANNSQGCNISDTLLITLMQCPEDIYFATAFTPNNDGVNDYFKALSQGNKPTFFELIIYNRFGLPIFKTNNINAGWNGQLNGNPQNPGGYVYICQYHFKNKPTSVLKGSFLLVR